MSGIVGILVEHLHAAGFGYVADQVASASDKPKLLEVLKVASDAFETYSHRNSMALAFSARMKEIGIMIERGV